MCPVWNGSNGFRPDVKRIAALTDEPSSKHFTEAHPLVSVSQ